MSLGNLEEWGGLKVKDFDAAVGLTDPATEACRLTCAYDEGEKFDADLEKLIADPRSGELVSLVIGDWGNAAEGDGPTKPTKALIDNKDKLSSLRHLFIGDMNGEECEVSWINQGDITPICEAFPGLESIGVRGSEGLKITPFRHVALQRIVIECGGLPSSVVAGLGQCVLPELEHLELYCGTDNYGWDGAAGLTPILKGDPFPKLKYLGLRSAEEADEIAKVVADSPEILERIDELDMSLGALTDIGAKALIESGHLPQLKELNIHHHYVTDPVVKELTAIEGVKVDASHSGDEEEEDWGDGEWYRYIGVSE